MRAEPQRGAVAGMPANIATVPTTKADLKLRLYVAGNAPNSVRAIANARAICTEHFPSGYELEIVDLFLHPQRGMDDKILVTPTLLKLVPGPMQRLIGDLSDTQTILMTLSLE